MQKQKRILIILLILAVLGGGGITFYYSYQAGHYVTTEDARIAADTVVISPQISGKLIDWNVTEGSEVQAGQKLGQISLASVLNSVGISVEGLDQSGSSYAQKAEIMAPIAGKVIKSQGLVGEMVSPGQSLAIIAATGDMYISANIEETEIGKVKKGQEVEISVDAVPDQKFTGFVDGIGQATTSTFSVISTQSSNGNFTKVTQLIPIKVRFSEINNINVVPGMNVVIKILVNNGN
ncbi:MAG: HlyD family secretion protein [Peptococcaceae bacterium]